MLILKSNQNLILRIHPMMWLFSNLAINLIALMVVQIRQRYVILNIYVPIVLIRLMVQVPVQIPEIKFLFSPSRKI